MPEIPNITGNISRLREKRNQTLFREETARPRKTPKNTQDTGAKRLRSSALSWLAIGLAGALIAFEIVAANLFTLLSN